jgi:hypothetical protein
MESFRMFSTVERKIFIVQILYVLLLFSAKFCKGRVLHRLKLPSPQKSDSIQKTAEVRKREEGWGMSNCGTKPTKISAHILKS